MDKKGAGFSYSAWRSFVEVRLAYAFLGPALLILQPRVVLQLCCVLDIYCLRPFTEWGGC